MSEGQNKKMCLIINHRLIMELYRLIGRQQFIQCERITITEFINSILAEYVNSHLQSKTLLTEEEEACTSVKS